MATKSKADVTEQEYADLEPRLLDPGYQLFAQHELVG